MLYSEKADQYPLLADAVEGKISVLAHLEDLVGQMDDAIGSPATSGELAECLEGHMEMLTTLGYLEPQLPAQHEMFGKEWLKGYLAVIVPAALAIFGAVSIMPAVLPALGVTFIGAGLGIQLCAYAGRLFQTKAVLRERKPLLNAVYQAAEQLDTDVGCLFPEVQFSKARPHFEENYLRMPADRREEVDAKLHSYLAAGGIPEMGQDQLDNYLGGLLRAKGDA